MKSNFDRMLSSEDVMRRRASFLQRIHVDGPLLVLLLMNRGFRALEAFVIALLMVIFGCFMVQIALAAPPVLKAGEDEFQPQMIVVAHDISPADMLAFRDRGGAQRAADAQHGRVVRGHRHHHRARPRDRRGGAPPRPGRTHL